jgi:two-component sensor histidine kinase
MPQQLSENNESEKAMPLTESPEFQATLVRQLHAQSRMGIYWALVSVIIVAFALRGQVSDVEIGIWLIIYLVVQGYRYYLMISFSKWSNPEEIISWGRKFTLSTIASGLTWGLAPIIIFPEGSLVHQMFLVICLSGIAAAAASVYSPVTLCYLPTAIAILVPLSARFFYQRQEVDVLIGIVMIILLSALLMTGKQMHAAIMESLVLRFENKDLLDSVTDQKRIAENLLKEIHHRVKNNLQVICSLLRLQGRHLESDETRMIFKDTEFRVRSMAMLHESLYQSEDLERISAKNYIENLATQILEAYGGAGNEIKLKMSIESTDFTIDTAIPCGLIINELVTNALKHAFSDNRGGEIGVFLRSTEDRGLELVVRDNGCGTPKEMMGEMTKSLGMNLVRTFVKQLGGDMKVDVINGSEFRIRFSVQSDNASR